ncbi:MarR family winged helix-turn-helix transcriptional regulator [Saccharopolyspora griseoalba]|uniref:MarR family winged helix-turn-helix transcriptional regulator n=1 Tax=Saccharopolyspora griseoalba TaxID=1431848 RepID=A0ABW2LGZ5_9PSEU
MDVVGRISAQWRERYPDLDLSPIEVAGRVRRLGVLAGNLPDRVVGDARLTRVEFEVLSALHRAGGAMRPSRLTRETLSSGAATTKRLAKLAEEGLITRSTSGHDRREVDVRLTDRGREIVERVFPAQVEWERELLAPLDEGERAQLADLLAKVLEPLDPPG